MPYVDRIEVIYDDEKPADTINEINGKSADINKGFGGKCVWLRIIPATMKWDQVDAIWTDIWPDADDTRDDIAKGAGGDYRYVGLSKDVESDEYIADVALWRSTDEQTQAPPGWDTLGLNINEGRGGDYLYFVFKNVQRSDSLYGVSRWD